MIIRPWFTSVTCATSGLSWVSYRAPEPKMHSTASAGVGPRGLGTGKVALGSGEVRLTVCSHQSRPLALPLAKDERMSTPSVTNAHAITFLTRV